MHCLMEMQGQEPQASSLGDSGGPEKLNRLPRVQQPVSGGGERTVGSRPEPALGHP